MSAQIPARRTRQAIRPAADENANRGATTIRATRSKITAPLGGAGASNQPFEKPATVGSRAEQVAAAAKRKREALGEVTNKSKGIRGGLGGDGKGAGEKDGIHAKRLAPSTSATVTGARIPLGERRVLGGNLPAAAPRKTRSSLTRKDKVEEETNVDVDSLPVEPAPIRASRRISTRTSTTQTATGVPRVSTVTTLSSRRIASTFNAATTSTSNRLASRQISARRPLSIAQSRQAEPLEDEDEKPVHKKRRTSSVAAEEDLLDREDVDEALVDTVEPEELGIPEQDNALVGLGSAEGEVRWDDLDKEDAGDPLMVSEYVAEIFEYLLKLELVTMPNPKYMDTQAELAWRMRGILTDWLIQIHGRFRLLPETLFLTINIIDRFLSSRVVSLVKLQLVGVTALLIAAKYEEILAPSVANFLASADGNYNEKDILEAEKYILRTLDWNLSYPNPIHYLRRASKADGYDLAVRTVAKYFIEISCLEHRLLDATPSQIAAAGIWLARLVLDKEEWTPNLTYYSGYAENAIIPVARTMLNYVLKPTRHDNFFKKYAARKFMKASPFVYSWARDRWPEGTTVDLEEELPELRRAAQARRDAGQAAGTLAEEHGVLVG
ncbi:G2/mitotic-specific cyclin [Tulasnella sp. 330]|nr:G2/mitotic-specific cyclin [Tulasnella sp. 330]KAG8885018.1 G2/mitotic-specific cyclin [Tulasnella sp. 331]KAG8890909.1 G2/mitotic-specific cyclin [Tulasnella sp. 332]